MSKSVPPVYLMPQGDFTDMRECMSDDKLLIPEMKLNAPEKERR